MSILAIDPGKSGGFAWRDYLGNARAVKMPPEDELAGLIESIGPERAVLEKVGGFIQGQNLPSSRMFTFGENYGLLRGVLRGLKIPFAVVTPQSWQRGLGCRFRRSMEAREWKPYLKKLAQARFPLLKVTLKTADALLILRYSELSTLGAD